MKKTECLLEIKSHLLDIFNKVTNILALDSTVSDSNLDEKILGLLFSETYQTQEINIQFSEPIDEIYKASAGRTPYDILFFGEINETPFKILLNNKYGEIDSRIRNDTTTYNNLLRLYLDIPTQRVKKGVHPNYDTIQSRIKGEELFAYAIYILDKDSRKYNFFYLEEVEEEFYINPRNSMFQVRYNPRIRDKPMRYYLFIQSLIEESIRALEKKIKSAKEEKEVLKEYYSKFASLNNEKEIRNRSLPDDFEV